jgi:hypothetical protein
MNLNFAKVIKSFRYVVLRSLSLPTPCLKSSIFFVGGKSLIEVIFIVCLLLVCFAYPSMNAGVVTSALGGGIILSAFRHNINTYIFGISFERALFYHKIATLLYLASMLCHILAVGLNFTGFLLIGFSASLCTSYIIKSRYFEVFYYLHIASFVGLVTTSFFHANLMGMYIPGGLWFLDIFLRYCIFRTNVKAVLKLLPGDIVRISFPAKSNSFTNYEPGQYCFISIQKLGRFEYHPFSISSCPSEENVSFHIRALGNWTKQLKDLVGANKGTLELPISVEGPYGSPTIDLFTNKYKVYLLISGGIGVTPLQSVFNHLVSQQRCHELPGIRKVIIITSLCNCLLVF